MLQFLDIVVTLVAAVVFAWFAHIVVANAPRNSWHDHEEEER